jgi:murein DD-endopeptidase MepM/ murein hydrolase activator NlpD
LFSFCYLIVILIVQTFNFIKEERKKHLFDVLNNIYFEKTLHIIFNNLEPKYINIEHKVSPGESFNSILTKHKIPLKEINKIKKELAKKNNLNKLKTNQIIKFTVDVSDSKKIISFLYPVSRTKKIKVVRNLVNDNFDYQEIITNLNKKIIYKEGKILQSLYKSAVNQKVQPNIIIDFARIYGFQLDFQRDIRKGDWFEILYEKFEDDNNKVRDTGKIIYASMYVNGEEINLYNFNYKNEQEYYDIKGKSITKSLMKTPINGARLSSSFGMRKHPILGYNKMHRGTDFAAPSGTPIMASGSGTVTRARWCGGGGNCVKIKHNSTYETIYAHMKAFAKGVREGKKVKQGQIIGYVGSTGLSTGPHLHYEVLVNGKKVNSQKLKLPSGKILKGDARKQFELDRIKTDLKLANLR